MTDPVDAAALRDATGSGAAAPGKPVLRELKGLAVAPVSVVYRSFLLRGSEYGLGSDAILTDDYGRPIRLIEGLAFRQPEAALQELGITQADLDRAHAEVTSAYQAFWSDGTAFARRTSSPLPTGRGSLGSAIALASAEPWVARGKDPVHAPPTSLPPDALSESGPSAESTSPPSPSRVRRVNIAGVLVLALVLAFIALLILLIVNLVSPGPPASRTHPASRTAHSQQALSRGTSQGGSVKLTYSPPRAATGDVRPAAVASRGHGLLASLPGAPGRVARDPNDQRRNQDGGEHQRHEQ